MSEQKEKVIKFKKRHTKAIIFGVLLLLVAGVSILMTCFKIDDIEVTGNVHYTEDEIREIVLSNGYVDNTILLMLKNKFKPIQDVPFIAKLDVEFVSAHRVTVTVYEKAMAGCVEYMNRYIYFDQDGYVLEISLTKLSDTPCITGMSFDSMELHEKLPIEDKERFRLILRLTQLIQKYEVQIDAIRFTSDGDIVLTYEDIQVELGDGSRMEEQLVDLSRILEQLKGKKGTLDMTEFDTATGTASFRIETEKKPENTTESTENDSEGV